MSERKPLVTHIYTADPSAHVFDGKIYVYPSHDLDHDIPDSKEGNVYMMDCGCGMFESAKLSCLCLETKEIIYV